MIGQVIGNFRVVAQLGRGGMGEVYRAEHVSVGTQVAIKVLGSDLSADADLVQRLFNEARAASKIQHGGIVQIFDVGRAPDGRAYLIMELLVGESLRQALVRGRMTATTIANIGRQLAVVLEAVHAAGITHRDLKPDNVFLVSDPQVTGGVRVKVLDFGIAKLTGTLRAQSPRTHGAMGTPAYMAPEQWGPPEAIDARADLYAFGCVVFEMATGRPPFLVESMADACNRHINEPPPRARVIAGDVPEPLDALLDRLLAKAPAARASIRDAILTFDALASGQQGAVDLQRTMNTMPPLQAATEPAPQAPVRKSRRWAWLPALIAVLAVGVVALVATRGPDSKAKPTAPGLAPQAGSAGAGSAVSAPVVDAELVAWLAEQNPWFVDGEVPVQYHAVRRREYANYVSRLPPEEAKWAAPLFTSATDAEDAAQTWVTWEQADRYCKVIGGKLLSSQRWEQTSAGKEGIAPQGVRYWTSTKSGNGKAMVRGLFAELPVDHPTNKKPWQQWWDTEASAGGRDPIEKVASRQIGFRCTR